jgi:hypothetical protein
MVNRDRKPTFIQEWVEVWLNDESKPIWTPAWVCVFDLLKDLKQWLEDLGWIRIQSKFSIHPKIRNNESKTFHKPEFSSSFRSIQAFETINEKIFDPSEDSNHESNLRRILIQIKFSIYSRIQKYAAKTFDESGFSSSYWSTQGLEKMHRKPSMNSDSVRVFGLLEDSKQCIENLRCIWIQFIFDLLEDSKQWTTRGCETINRKPSMNLDSVQVFDLLNSRIRNNEPKTFDESGFGSSFRSTQLKDSRQWTENLRCIWIRFTFSIWAENLRWIWIQFKFLIQWNIQNEEPMTLMQSFS